MTLNDTIDQIQIHIQVYHSIEQNLKSYDKEKLTEIVDTLDGFVSSLMRNMAILQNIQTNIKNYLKKPANFTICED